MSFGIEHILTIIGLVITLIFSIIGVIQTRNAKKLSKKANDIAQESLEENKKERLPFLEFVGSIRYEELPQKIACIEATFDIANVLSEKDYSDDVSVISATVKNTGKEDVSGILIKSFFLYAGDGTSLEVCLNLSDVVSYRPIDCQKEFILKPEGKKEIYFAIPDEAKGRVKEIVASDSFILSIEFEMMSKTEYSKKQKGLTAIVVFGEVKNNNISSISLD